MGFLLLLWDYIAHLNARAVMTTTSHQRIAKNSIVLYLRMIVMMGISIFTTRIVLEGLGVVDFGIYNIVGGVIGFITMVTGALTISVQRFLNFELGKESSGNVSEVFSSALLIHLGIALVLLAILETLGYWYFSTSIKIPAAQHQAAMIVYHLSSIAACITLFASPFLALSISYERMGIYAGMTVGDVVLRLIAAYLMLMEKSDRLVYYGVFILGAACISALSYIVIWLTMFKDVRFTVKLQKSLFIQITSFASWNGLNQLAWAFTLQGVNILLNLFFGNVLNAAYGVTSQMRNAFNRFVQSFQTAINPQIIKNYARQDIREMMVLVFSGTRFSSLMVLMMAIPFWIEMDAILNIWLTDVPPYTLAFCRIMLVTILLDALSSYFEIAIMATGKIRNYQILCSAVLFLNFPFSYLLIRLTHLPYVIYYVYGFVSVCILCLRIHLVTRKLEVHIWGDFLRGVLWPVAKVLVCAAPLSYLMYKCLGGLPMVAQFITVIILSVVITALSSMALGLTAAERERVISIVKNKIRRR